MITYSTQSRFSLGMRFFGVISTAFLSFYGLHLLTSLFSSTEPVTAGVAAKCAAGAACMIVGFLKTWD